jgi:hypothetical protein
MQYQLDEPVFEIVAVGLRRARGHRGPCIVSA